MVILSTDFYYRGADRLAFTYEEDHFQSICISVVSAHDPVKFVPVINKSDMTVKLVKDRTVNDVQQEFNNAFAFLCINFYKHTKGRLDSIIKQKLSKSTSLFNAGLREEGQMEVNESMTVKELEKTFLDKFGLKAQVSRKSGSIWLETTISDSWTLKQQNDHGCELSEPVRKGLLPDEVDYD